MSETTTLGDWARAMAKRTMELGAQCAANADPIGAFDTLARDLRSLADVADALDGQRAELQAQCAAYARVIAGALAGAVPVPERGYLQDAQPACEYWVVVLKRDSGPCCAKIVGGPGPVLYSTPAEAEQVLANVEDTELRECFEVRPVYLSWQYPAVLPDVPAHVRAEAIEECAKIADAKGRECMDEARRASAECKQAHVYICTTPDYLTEWLCRRALAGDQAPEEAPDDH